jgi:hypothetical protein
MFEQDTYEFPVEYREGSEPRSQNGEPSPEEPSGGWESYSLSILSIFFENC